MFIYLGDDLYEEDFTSKNKKNNYKIKKPIPRFILSAEDSIVWSLLCMGYSNDNTYIINLKHMS